MNMLLIDTMNLTDSQKTILKSSFSYLEDLLMHLRKAEKDVLVFFLLTSKGFTIEEIANVLGVTKNQIYGRVNRFR